MFKLEKEDIILNFQDKLSILEFVKYKINFIIESFNIEYDLLLDESKVIRN